MLYLRKVFVSHSGKDNELVDQFASSLKAIDIIPFLAERVSVAGESVPKKIGVNIRNSNAFVPFLTANSLTNQWVNQEIGYASRCKEQEERDPPYFFPVLEKKLERSIKGFLGIPVTEYIPLRTGHPQESIHKLLMNLRKYIDREYVILKKLHLTCPSCKHAFKTSLPPQKTIDSAIEKKQPLERVCRSCSVKMTVNPYTLQAIALGGQGWK